MDLILKNGTVVNAHETVAADIGIENGLIKRIGYDIGPTPRRHDLAGRLFKLIRRLAPETHGHRYT